MPSLSDIGSWITDHESLLSGLAAMIALIGVTLSAAGTGIRRLIGRRGSKPPTVVRSEAAVVGPSLVTGRSGPLLAVLAFDNLSSDPEMQFFSDGISEEIIQRLARGAKLRIVGKLSSFQFRGDRKIEAADRLQCSHVLDGSVRRAEGRIRISAHLIEAGSKTTLWSERYDRSLADVFAVQDEISDQIARALDQTFSAFGARSIDPAVHDLYLRAAPKAYAPDDAYRVAESARLGPMGTRDDVMGPDGYRTSLLFQAGMPELRSDPRFPRLCARLGLVEFWLATRKWPDCADGLPYDFRVECEKVRGVPVESFTPPGHDARAPFRPIRGRRRPCARLFDVSPGRGMAAPPGLA